jgi:hypothetical protein
MDVSDASFYIQAMKITKIKGNLRALQVTAHLGLATQSKVLL